MNIVALDVEIENERLIFGWLYTYWFLLPFRFLNNCCLDQIKQSVNVQVWFRYVRQYALREKPCWC